MMPPQSCSTNVAPDSESSIDKQRPHPLDVAQNRVVGHLAGLVGQAHADQVGGDDPVARSHRGGDLVAPDVRPRRVAMQEHDNRSVRAADRRVIHEVDAQLLVVVLHRQPGS